MRSIHRRLAAGLLAAGLCAAAGATEAQTRLRPEILQPTYTASVSGQATTAAVVLSIEAPAGNRLRLIRWCAGTSNATAAAAVTITVQRRTTASSGGTALTAEGTGTTAVSKHHPANANFPGVARLGGTPGTAGAVLDQVGFTVGEIGAGAADPPGPRPFCWPAAAGLSSQAYTIERGTANGISLTLSAAGAGGLAAGSLSATVVVE